MSTEPPTLTFAGKLVIFLFIAACLFGAYYVFIHRPDFSITDKPQVKDEPAVAAKRPQDGITIGVAYGTEKKRWLKWAVKEFAKSDVGSGIKVDLIPMGSLEGAKALINGDKRIHVWSPASALYKDIFIRDWEAKYSTKPIIKEENLALTPMVFVMWEERYDSFTAKYQEVSLKTIALALQEKGGWDAIAGKPEWGLFKFGHTDPNRSNSGLMSLVLMAYDYNNLCRDLPLKAIVNVDFQDWMQQFERAVSGLVHSTGTMMRDMVLKGPSTYDALLVYESVAIDYLKNAEGRWGRLKVAYPEKNLWNENPYCIIDAPWSSKEQRKAAAALLEFLMSERIQKQSLVHGFRPGNPAAPIKFPDSPFNQYEQYGLRVDVPTVCAPPKAEAINNLLASWLRGQRPR
jgi:ABC-type Fe3+ transport system substrate-binding protein